MYRVYNDFVLYGFHELIWISMHDLVIWWKRCSLLLFQMRMERVSEWQQQSNAQTRKNILKLYYFYAKYISLKPRWLSWFFNAVFCSPHCNFTNRTKRRQSTYIVANLRRFCQFYFSFITFYSFHFHYSYKNNTHDPYEVKLFQKRFVQNGQQEHGFDYYFYYYYIVADTLSIFRKCISKKREPSQKETNPIKMNEQKCGLYCRIKLSLVCTESTAQLQK